MSLDFMKLVAQGRAKAINKPWENEELEALILLEKERGLSRIVAADFVRNGILTLEAYDKAQESDFKPMSLSEAEAKSHSELGQRGAEFSAKPEVAKDKPKASKKKLK